MYLFIPFLFQVHCVYIILFPRHFRLICRLILRSCSSFYVNKSTKAEAKSFLESFFLDYPIYIYMVSYSLHHEDGRVCIFQRQWGVYLIIWTVGGLLHMGHMGESELGISLGGLQYQFLAQLANAGPSL